MAPKIHLSLVSVPDLEGEVSSVTDLPHMEFVIAQLLLTQHHMSKEVVPSSTRMRIIILLPRFPKPG